MSYFRVILSGNSPAPGEVWSVGFAFDGPDVTATFAEMSTWAADIAADIVASTGNAAIATLSSTGSITQVRCEQRSAADEALLVAAEAQLSSPEVGSGTSQHPMQTAMVISLKSTQPGRSRRGRIYWPAWSAAITGDGRFGSALLNGVLGGIKALVQLMQASAVGTNPAWDFELAVRSRLLHQNTTITTLEAGNVPDTQRRRRDGLVEVYQTLAL